MENSWRKLDLLGSYFAAFRICEPKVNVPYFISKVQCFFSDKGSCVNDVRFLSHFWLLLPPPLKSDIIYVCSLSMYMFEFTHKSHTKYWRQNSNMCVCCNKITTTWIQISRQNWNGVFSNASHQIMNLTTAKKR